MKIRITDLTTAQNILGIEEFPENVVYYLKYDEENKMDRSEHTGQFMLMQDNIGRREIAFNELKSSSYNFVAEDASGKIRHKPQELKPAKYNEKSDVHLIKPFKLWNPLTW